MLCDDFPDASPDASADVNSEEDEAVLGMSGGGGG